MIGFLLGLSSASCLLAWLVWRDAREGDRIAAKALADWQPRRPYRVLR
jgi:hypothetical protein